MSQMRGEKVQRENLEWHQKKGRVGKEPVKEIGKEWPKEEKPRKYGIMEVEKKSLSSSKEDFEGKKWVVIDV